jgi:hypothetical protein
MRRARLLGLRNLETSEIPVVMDNQEYRDAGYDAQS